MKIQQINEHQLELHVSGNGNVVLAAIFIVIGAGTAISPLLTSSSPWWMIFVGIFFGGMGVLSALSATKTDAVLRNDAASLITKTKVLSKQSEQLTFESSQLTFVGLDTRTEHDRSSNNGTPTRRRVSTLFIALNDNTQVPIATARSNSSSINGIRLDSFGKAPLSAEAKQIADFYGVQVNATSTSDVGVEQLAQAAGTFVQSFTQRPDQPLSAAPQTPPAAAPPETPAAPSPLPAQPIPQTPTLSSEPQPAQPTAPAPSTAPQPQPAPANPQAPHDLTRQ